MKIQTGLACLPLLCALLSGCALSTDKIELSYLPRGARDRIPGAQAVKVSVTLNDNREVRDKVGKKVNGYGHEMGAIVSTTDVTELVRGAIETELAARGFAHGDAVAVLCQLNLFYNHFKVGFFAGDSIAEINLGVQVKTAGGQVLYSKTLDEQGLEPNIQVAAGHNAKPALEMALAKAITNLFDDPAFTAAILKAGS